MRPAFNPNDGGVQRTTFKLGKKFTELGHEVFYFSLSHNGHINPDSGTLYHANSPGTSKNTANIEELKKVVRTIDPDFVINQMPYEFEMSEALNALRSSQKFTLFGCLRNSLFSVKNNLRETAQQVLPKVFFKLLDHKLGHYLLLQAHRFKHRGQLRKILDLHDKFILLAPPNNDELRFFVGSYKNDKTLVIPNSIPAISTSGISEEKLLLHVGRLNIPQKRSDLLLPVWKLICDEVPDWQFAIVGDGPYYDHMQRVILDQQIPRVTMHGYQKPEAWYEKAPIFMMTSAFEGFPNVLLEAQSFGCVAVAFNSYDAIDWIVNHKEDALLIEPYDTKAMAKSILSLIENSDKRNEMAINSKKNASQFVINNVALKWQELFESYHN